MQNRIAAAAIAATLTGVIGFAGARVHAQTATPSAVLLVLDEDAVDYGNPPHLLPADAVDPTIAAVGVRDELRYFQNHLGAQVILTSGRAGNPGWFAIPSVPAAWTTPEVGGLENFALAGPGVGSPDDNGDRESLLGSVPNVTPLGPADFVALVGRTVCAVVYAGEITTAPAATSLQGPTLGRIAFTVVSLAPTDDPAQPNIQVQIAEGHQVCGGTLAPFTAAPVAPP